MLSICASESAIEWAAKKCLSVGRMRAPGASP